MEVSRLTQQNISSASRHGSLPEALYTAQQTRALDQYAIETAAIPGIRLMRRAADACVAALNAAWPQTTHVLVFCGSGNNAADGYIVAGLLAAQGVEVDVVVIGDVTKLSDDGQRARAFCLESKARCTNASESIPLQASTVIVDALLGTGARGELRAAYKQAIDVINNAGRPVLAVDLPSGLNADTGTCLTYTNPETGEVTESAVVASITVTFIGLKRGQFTHHGVDHCGEIKFAALDVPEAVYDAVPADMVRLDYETLISSFPARPRNAHKNTFGHVLVVGGDKGMGGAVAMAAESALRSGAGLVSVATHVDHAAAIVNRRPELMVKGFANPSDPDEQALLADMIAAARVIVLGPGLVKSDWGAGLFAQVIAAECPMVVDADGLNFLAKQKGPFLNRSWVLTPHPGEASRLLDTTNIQSDRFQAAEKLQQQYSGVAVLKGAGTLVISETGRGLCPYGNPGMSTAGMGDVLTGVIGALLAQGCGLEQAARLGVVVHSLAADKITRVEGERGLLALDLLPAIRRLLNAI